MGAGTTILLGAFAGLTIYLGLPVARLRGLSKSIKTFLSMLATGVLLFLLYDMIGKASEPIGAAMDMVRTHGASGGTQLVASALPEFLTDVALLVFGLMIGLIGLVYFNRYARYLHQRRTNAAVSRLLAATATPDASDAVELGTVASIATLVAESKAAESTGEVSPRTLALMIASGIGLHNFSEGLAIGQSAASGALQLAAILIIGFGLHNMTEGFGIAGPLTGQVVSWKFLALIGLIGGGPTFLGTVIGTIFNSPQLFIFCLALAAGAIIFVVAELLGSAKKFKAQEVVMWGLLSGFLLGYGTDLIVTFAGA